MTRSRAERQLALFSSIASERDRFTLFSERKRIYIFRLSYCYLLNDLAVKIIVTQFSGEDLVKNRIEVLKRAVEEKERIHY